MYIETAIAKYTLTFSILAEVAAVLKTALGVPGIGKRVVGVVKRVSL